MSSSDAFNQPFLPPPRGVVPNFTKPHTIGRSLTITCSVFLSIMIVFVMVRVYTKLRIVKKATWDDLTCIVGFLLTVIYYALCVREELIGYLGYHSWDVTLGQLLTSDLFMLSYAQQLVGPLALGFIKVSYFILYFQIFKPVPKMRVAIWVGGALSTVFYILVFALHTYFATPRPGESFVTHPLGRVSRQERQLAIPMSAIGLVFDLYIITLPIYGVWQLQLSTQKKLSISFVFLTGAFACVCAMLTLNYRISLQNTNDILRTVCLILTTTLVEMMIGVICTCAPSFNKFLHEHPPWVETLKSNLQSRLSLTRQRLLLNSTKSSLGYERGDSDRPYQGQPIERKSVESRGYEFDDSRSFQTLVAGESEGFANGDSIHLRNDILQEREAIDRSTQNDKRECASSRKAREIEMV